MESEHFPDTPMETLLMHPANTEDARNGAGQSQTCRVLETPNTLCNRNLSFLLLGFLANFPEYFLENRVMRNGFFSSLINRVLVRNKFRSEFGAQRIYLGSQRFSIARNKNGKSFKNPCP